VEGVSAGYDGAVVLHEASLVVAVGEFVTLVGGNGAGKTTLLRAVTGLVPVRAGAIRLDGRRIDGLRPYHIAALGVATVPEGRRLFGELSVRDNLLLGAYQPAARREAAATLAVVERLFPVLRDRRDQPAASLSGGEQQMAAIGRALMARPRLLVLDDPFLGLAGSVVAEVDAVLRRLVDDEGLTMLAAGQHVRRLLRLADRGYLLEEGRVVLDGRAEALSAHPRVRSGLLEWTER
jgi:branched-chain amino acid transport system ATP-binding protein